MAAVDYLLEIDGIKGESSDSKFKDAIEVQSFGWGVANTGTHAGGGGGGAGKAKFADLSFTSTVNKASPLLMLACATGQHIKKAVLHVRKQGGDQQEYMTITLEDLLVSSYQNGDAPGGDVAVIDSFSLNYAKIKYEYKPQKPDGTLDSAVTAGYDLKANKKA
jgi:type VI secretion system secreted protein Hcp